MSYNQFQNEVTDDEASVHYSRPDEELDERTISPYEGRGSMSLNNSKIEESDITVESAFQQTYGNPYESSAAIIFSLASALSSIAFGTWAFIIYSNQLSTKTRTSSFCNTSQILDLLLATAIMDVILGVGLIISGAMGFIFNLLVSKHDFTIKLLTLLGRIVLTVAVFSTSVSLSTRLWGDSCHTRQTPFYDELNLYMHVFWLVDVILLLIVLYTSTVKVLRDWETQKVQWRKTNIGKRATRRN